MNRTIDGVTLAIEHTVKVQTHRCVLVCDVVDIGLSTTGVHQSLGCTSEVCCEAREHG